MATYTEATDCTPEELTEIDRRLADPDPKYCEPDEVERLLRRAPLA